MPAKPHIGELLTGDDGGPVIMVRAATLDEATRIAHEEAAGEELVVCDPEAARLGWVRAVPCVPVLRAGHWVAEDWCPGGLRCHYIPSAPGPGAFRGVFFDVTSADDFEDGDPAKAPYLAACAAMKARALPGEETGDGA